MNHQTKVTNIKVKPSAVRLQSSPKVATELPPKTKGLGSRFLQLDMLVRNLVAVGGMVLVLVAVRNSTAPEAQSVFGALQSTAGMQWDESIGKLSFVHSLLPKEIQEVWNESSPLEASLPTNGAILHAWSQDRPYVLMDSENGTVFASAEGEVMSIAHGLDEEKIVRIRHDGFETVYGNLKECSIELGDTVAMGQAIGSLLENYPLSFEIRLDGRSVDPARYFK